MEGHNPLVGECVCLCCSRPPERALQLILILSPDKCSWEMLMKEAYATSATSLVSLLLDYARILQLSEGMRVTSLFHGLPESRGMLFVEQVKLGTKSDLTQLRNACY